MPRAGLNPIVRQLARAVDLPDPELLRRFAAERDEVSFAALVRRHGPMVLDVCRSVLGRHADAEDAFQATFLVLARQAGTIRRPGSLAAWLHGVAFRTARKARSRASRRREQEARAHVSEQVEPDDLSWGEVRQVVHEELAALGDRYRVPLVLCYLRGLTQDQAADALGLSRVALKKRLERGREKLRAALTRRGLGPTAVLAAVTFPPATTAVPSALESAAVALAADPGAASASVLNLALGGSNPVSTSKLIVSLCLLPAAALGLGLLGDPGRPGPLPGNTAAAAEQPPRSESRLTPPTDAVLKWLAGEWVVRHVETEGSPLFTANELDGARITFKGDRAEVAGFRVLFVRNFSFKLTPDQDPKGIDVTFLEGPRKGQTFEGIYVARKNELRICLRLMSTAMGRPAGFVTSGGPTLYTFILEPTTAKDPPPVPAARPEVRPAANRFPELHGKVTEVLGSVGSYVPPEAGSAFQLDLNDVSKLTSLTFGPANRMSVPLPGPVAVESTHYYSNGAFRSMRLVSKKGTQSVTIDVVPKPGLGDPNRVHVWIVVQSDVVQGVVRIDAASEGTFPDRPRPVR